MVTILKQSRGTKMWMRRRRGTVSPEAFLVAREAIEERNMIIVLEVERSCTDHIRPLE